MSTETPDRLETDPRFPTGLWRGFFVQTHYPPGRYPTELHLTFREGRIGGEGRDWVGRFVVAGRYDLGDGRCSWSKRYLGRHEVLYHGYNEGKGIWGTWEINESDESENSFYVKGGFHIWPQGMPDPCTPQLSEEADPPVTVVEPELVSAPV